jgi:hypothetical protein
MVPAGQGEWLFNGLSIDGWLPRSGQWKMLEDEEGNVISGAGGVFRRTLPRLPGGPSLAFRITATFRLHQADAVEFHFAVQPMPGDNGPRFVLRITPEGAVLGQRPSDRGEFVASLPLLATPVEPGTLYAVQVERQHGYWYALLHGKEVQLVGALPGREGPERGGPESPEIRLAAEGDAGPAYFADILVEELGPAK